MRIAHVSHRDAVGGAAIAAYSLHEQLRGRGVDSRMVVATKRGSDPHVYQSLSGARHLTWRLKKKVSRALELLQRDRSSHFYSLNLFGSGILDAVNRLRPDVVHLHWIGGETACIEELGQLGVPIVWTLHDMWPFCGAEHLNLDLEGERWVSGYSKGNRSAGSFGLDWNRRVWERKRLAWQGLGMVALCPSTWSQSCLERSKLLELGAFGDSAVIPNAVDTGTFRPSGDVEAARARFGLSLEKPLLAFGASKLDVPSKGIGLLLDALSSLARRMDFELVTFGQGRLPGGDGYRVVNLAELTEPAELSKLYSCCNLTLVPSLIESFGLVAAESLSSGTPVVCFDVSGLKDVVDHKESGYRAKAFSIEDYVDGILWCLADRDRHRSLRLNARKKVLSAFRIESVIEQHIELYQDVLSRG